VNNEVVVKKKSTIRNIKKITFPLSTQKSILEELRKESEYDATSLNAKINNILTDYVLWYRNVEQQDGVVIQIGRAHV
jgi:hypothetical protein